MIAQNSARRLLQFQLEKNVFLVFLSSFQAWILVFSVEMIKWNIFALSLDIYLIISCLRRVCSDRVWKLKSVAYMIV